MTSEDLLDALGDTTSDPFLDDAFSAVDSGGALDELLSNGPRGGGGGSMGGSAHSAVDVLPLDSVFFDDEILPAQRPPAEAPPPPAAPAPAVPSAPAAVSAGPLTLPERPQPGMQFTSLVSKADVGAMNAAIQGGWHVVHAVTIGTEGEAMIVFEYGADGPPSASSAAAL